MVQLQKSAKSSCSKLKGSNGDVLAYQTVLSAKARKQGSPCVTSYFRQTVVVFIFKSSANQ